MHDKVGCGSQEPVAGRNRGVTMTKKQLQQIRHYDNELKILRRHLADLEAQVGASAIRCDGQPHGTKIGRPTEMQAIALGDTITHIRYLEEKVATARDEAWTFVSSLEDSLLRQIIILRFIDGKSWYKVSEAIGGEATADSCRMLFSRARWEE